MSVYDFTSYKKFIESECERQGISYVDISESAGVQKSYLSQVLRRATHLSEDQAYGVATRLRLNDEELRYFLLLVREARAGRADFKRHLAESIEGIREEKANLGRRLISEKTARNESGREEHEYYLNGDVQALHMHFLIPEFQRHPDRLRIKLNLDLPDFERALDTLERLGLIERRASQIRIKKSFVHIEEGSTLSKQNHLVWRSWALTRKAKREAHDYQMTGMFTGDREAKHELRERIRNLIVDFQKNLRKVKDEKVFQLNIDLLDF